MSSDHHVLTLVDDLLHGLLDKQQAVAVEEHCRQCPICEAALDEARKRYELLSSVVPSEASERLIQDTLNRVAEHNPRLERLRRRLRPLAIWGSTVAAMLLIACTVIFSTSKPTPYDLRLLGQDEWLPGSMAAVRIGVFHAINGAAIGDVPVTLELGNPQTDSWHQLATLTSGASTASGVRFRVPEWDDGQYQLRLTAQTQGRSESMVRQVSLRRSWKVMLTSDKPVYRPGQTIHIRALTLRRPDLKPVAGQDATFRIVDPQGTTIFKRSDVTSRYGILSADCPLAEQVRHGQYQLECRLGNTVSRQTVKVESYVLPKFKVGLELDKKFYLSGDRVRATVQADYFFGQPVAEGMAIFEARSVDAGEHVFHRATVALNGQGAASVEFVLPRTMVGRPQNQGDAEFRLAVEVKDAGGQTHAVARRALVARQPLRLTVIPEAGTLVRGLSNRVYIFASYPDGRPASVELSVSGQESVPATNALGLSWVDITTAADSYPVNVKATDGEGRLGQTQVVLRVGAWQGDFLLRPDRATCRVGDTVTLNVIGGGVEPVFVDWIKDGQTMLSEIVEMSDGSGILEVDVPPELTGTIRLVAFRYQQSGLPLRKEMLLYIRPSNTLRVSAAMDKKVYRPGDKARMVLSVRDGQGNPAPGAISLALVDEAVYAVSQQRPGLEETFFLLEKELLEPVFAVYPWAPASLQTSTMDDRIEFERALFARTQQADAGNRAIGVVMANSDPAEKVDWRTVSKANTVFRKAGTRSSRRPFNLTATSFPEKSEEHRREQSQRMGRTSVGWGLFVVWGLLLFAFYFPRVCAIVTGVGVGLCGLLFCSSLLLWGPGATFDSVGSSMVKSERSAAGGEPSDSAMKLDGADGPRVRVRQWFPETLLWRPEVITDEQGKAELEFELADSITSWHLSLSSVNAIGQLGSGQQSVRVFQPFFVDVDLPATLTRHDEVSLPAVVYNYSDQPQDVKLALRKQPWFEWIPGDRKQSGSTPPDKAGAQEPDEGRPVGDLTRTVSLKPGEVRSVRFPIRVLHVGRHTLELDARSKLAVDAVRREVQVVPNGSAVEILASGSGSGSSQPLIVPEEIVPGSGKLLVRIYPSRFSQLVDGLDAIFKMPHGCFEQTSSTTYPNVLALRYLRERKLSVPQVEAKARQYIQIGYQRLISFEVSGGGFDWFGRPPANTILTAYGLMEFEDMSAVYDVDPALLARTRRWLLRRRTADGSWPMETGLHSGQLARSRADLSATAYIGWSLFRGGDNSDAEPTLRYLLSHNPSSIDDPYTLALVVLALSAIDDQSPRITAYIDRLQKFQRSSDDGRQLWWELPVDARTRFHGHGVAGNIETTSLVLLALQTQRQYSTEIRQGLGWIATQRDNRGTWHSTQATVLALQALLAGSATGEQPAQIDLTLTAQSFGEPLRRSLAVPTDQLEVMQSVDLSSKIRAGDRLQLAVADVADTGIGYQILFGYHREGAAGRSADAPFKVEIAYDRQRLPIDETLTATATILNRQTRTAPMVILDLPIPPGFIMQRQELDELQGSGKIAKYQLTPRKTIVYLRELAASQMLELRYRLRATMPVKVAVPPAAAYEYYDPDKSGHSAGSTITVN